MSGRTASAAPAATTPQQKKKKALSKPAAAVLKGKAPVVAAAPRQAHKTRRLELGHVLDYKSTARVAYRAGIVQLNHRDAPFIEALDYLLRREAKQLVEDMVQYERSIGHVTLTGRAAREAGRRCFGINFVGHAVYPRSLPKKRRSNKTDDDAAAATPDDE